MTDNSATTWGGLRAVGMVLGLVMLVLFLGVALMAIGIDLADKGMRPGLVGAYGVVALLYLPGLIGGWLAVRQLRRIGRGASSAWLEILATLLCATSLFALLVVLAAG